MRHGTSFSRRNASEGYLIYSSLETRGRREGRAPAGTHGPRATKKHAAEPQVQPKIPGLPCANGFNGLLRALPGDHAWLPPSFADNSATLAPASERQDHTISPSAAASLVFSTPPRPPHPASTFVTTRTSLFDEADGAMKPLIWGRREAEYFLRADWTAKISLKCLRKLDFTRRR